MLLTSKLKARLVFVIVVLWLLCFAVPFFYWVFVGPVFWITNDPIPVNPPKTPTGDLLLDEMPFPPEWQIGVCEPDCNLAPSQSSRTFYRIGFPGHVLQDVFYYRTERDASTKFERYYETGSGTFTVPVKINYYSPIADEQYVYCGIVERNGIKVCQAGRRYGNYFIYFYFDIDTGDNDGLPSTKDIEPILQALDELVSERLDIPLPNE